jgi:hypothetical protein
MITYLYSFILTIHLLINHHVFITVEKQQQQQQQQQQQSIERIGYKNTDII